MPPAVTVTQSQFAVGGLLGYWFDRAVVEAYVTRDVYEKNYHGSRDQRRYASSSHLGILAVVRLRQLYPSHNEYVVDPANPNLNYGDALSR